MRNHMQNIPYFNVGSVERNYEHGIIQNKRHLYSLKSIWCINKVKLKQLEINLYWQDDSTPVVSAFGWHPGSRSSNSLIIQSDKQFCSICENSSFLSDKAKVHRCF